MPRVVFAALILVVVAIAGVQVFQAGLANAGEQVEINDESFTPNAGTVQQLDRSGLDNVYYTENVSVEDENGSRSFEGTDYEWFENNGTIKPLTGGNLDGDASATIDYSYRETTPEQRGFASLFANFMRVLPYIALALLGIAVIGVVGG